MMTIILLICIWFLSTVLIAGWIFADLQSIIFDDPVLLKRMTEANFIMSWALGIVSGLLGPIGIITVWLVSDRAKNGWRLPYVKK